LVAAAYSREEILRWLGQVADPEIPVLSITDLGIVRDVEIGETVTVALAPTYSGCPATEVIEHSVLEALREHGIEHAEIRRVLCSANTGSRRRRRAPANARCSAGTSTWPARAAARRQPSVSVNSGRRPARRPTAAANVSNRSNTSSASE
jgi:phenylacetate-CoA oxygenase PaaJ subunit